MMPWMRRMHGRTLRLARAKWGAEVFLHYSLLRTNDVNALDARTKLEGQGPRKFCVHYCALSVRHGPVGFRALHWDMQRQLTAQDTKKKQRSSTKTR